MTATLSSRPGRIPTLIPLALTLSNAVFGFLAVASLAAPGGAALGPAAVLLSLAVASDGLDGRVARRLRVSSPLGGELDSLADAVSFGVAPAFAIARIGGSTPLAFVAAVAYLAATLYRLARFNTLHDPGAGAHRSFLGLPSTGGAAGVLATAALALRAPAQRIALPLAGLALAWLMVSRIRYAHLLARLEGRSRVALLALGIGAGAAWLLGPPAIAVACLGYAVSGPLIAAARAAFAALRSREARHQPSRQ
jgi:CDP-diacylglycerol--serine O-phosphatidyltransferase